MFRIPPGTREISGWRRSGSFDDLVGAGEDQWRNGEAERVHGLAAGCFSPIEKL